MTAKKAVELAISNFVRGGDERDTGLLDKVLHDEFRLCSHSFMGSQELKIIDKQSYLANIRSGLFGGVPRKMIIESIDLSEKIAMVKLRLESDENHFVSYNSLILDENNAWKLINNVAVVHSK